MNILVHNHFTHPLYATSTSTFTFHRSFKCKLAEQHNKTQTLQEILTQKDEIIEDLDGILGSRGSNHDGYDSKKR